MSEPNGSMIEGIARRLEARTDVRQAARRILEQLRDGVAHGRSRDLLGTTGVLGICRSPEPDHQCGDPAHTYDDCIGVVQCGDKEKEGFDCSYFDCHTFTFKCDLTFDFACGENFDCHTQHTCASGHSFDCYELHECEVTFSCAATGKSPCTKTHDYVWEGGEPGGEKDTTPGDFNCGNSLLGASFECEKTFTCTAADDFDCGNAKADGDFDCGGTFACTGPGDEFVCFNDFDCKTTFNCKDYTGTDYKCLKQFECRQGAAFDCDAQPQYNCPARYENR